MNPMLERAAHAAAHAAQVAYAADADDETTISRGLALRICRAVIASLRDPLPDVVEAMCAAHPRLPYSSNTHLSEIVLAEHHALIDAVLGE